MGGRGWRMMLNLVLPTSTQRSIESSTAPRTFSSLRFPFLGQRAVDGDQECKVDPNVGGEGWSPTSDAKLLTDEITHGEARDPRWNLIWSCLPGKGPRNNGANNGT